MPGRPGGAFPREAEERPADIVSEARAGDGGAHNVLVDLARIDPVAAKVLARVRAAGACLGHETPTGGLRPVSELMK